MPRDSRLYMTFPIDFWTHPKVSRLSDAAFRAFVESNGQSRMRETDGVLEPDDAEFLWRSEVLEELLRSHPSRPLMVRDEDGNYVLRDYAEHQFTKADRDTLTQKRKDAAAKRWGKHASADQVQSNSEQTDARKEIGKGTGITTPDGVESARKRATSIPDPFVVTAAMREWAATEVPHVDVDRATRQFVDYWRAASGRTSTKKDWTAAWRYWLRNERGQQQTAPKQSKAAANAAEYRRLFGDGSEGSVPALDSGFS